MIRVSQLAEDGTETAVVEIDDFTVEVLYSGIADLLRDAAASPSPPPVSVTVSDLPFEARRRRERILTRIGV
jgi:hypothetical protein